MEQYLTTTITHEISLRTQGRILQVHPKQQME